MTAPTPDYAPGTIVEVRIGMSYRALEVLDVDTHGNVHGYEVDLTTHERLVRQGRWVFTWVYPHQVIPEEASA